MSGLESLGECSGQFAVGQRASGDEEQKPRGCDAPSQKAQGRRGRERENYRENYLDNYLDNYPENYRNSGLENYRENGHGIGGANGRQIDGSRQRCT